VGATPPHDAWVSGSRWIFATIVLASIQAACARPSPRGPSRELLAVDANTLARDDPKCARKIAASAFAYFRYTNRPFVDLVCARWTEAISEMPMVRSHGDAHLEQYAVAAEGRGLADFDASAIGPPIVDLARFATSLVLASPNDDAAARAAIEAFLRSYERALDDPTATVPEPTPAARLRSRFAPTPAVWLDRIEKLIIPTPPEDQPRYDASWADFVEQMRARDPSIGPGFFKIKVGGRLDAGIGSTHAEKFLVRIEGPTPAPEDDLVMEAKELEPGALGSCMRGGDLDPTRVIVGQSQLANTPQRFLGAVKIGGKQFYSHTWLAHYTELSVSDVRSGAELAELAEDVGLQLGRGHARALSDEPRASSLRVELKRTLHLVRPRLAREAVELAAEVTCAWQRYRAALPRMTSSRSGSDLR
jgi:Uncharacterized protein conserved in bacteria (DUF2252)